MSVIYSNSYSQNWEIIKNRGANGCYTTQIIETVKINKKTALDSEKYHYDITITFENALDVEISFNYLYSDAFGERKGRITLNPKEIKEISSSRQIPRNSQLNIQPIEASKLRYQNFEILGEKISQSEYVECLERFHLYKKKKQKEIRDKIENQNNSSDSSTASDKETDSSNNQSISNSSNSSDINSSNNSNSESIYEKKQREARLREKRRIEEERQKQKLLNNLNKNTNKSINNYNKSLQNLSNDINTWQRNIARNKIENDRYARELKEEQKRQQEEWDREREREKRAYEARKAKEEEKKRKERLRREKERQIRIKKENRSEFLNYKIYDSKMPLVVKQKELYFFIVQKGYNNGKVYLTFSDFSLYANENMQLPYKHKVMDKFAKEARAKGYYNQPNLFGPYNTVEEKMKTMNQLKTKAIELDIILRDDFPFNYEQPKTDLNSKNKNTDFWGKPKKETSKKTKTKKDFWN